jgi:hypothetical protein
MMHVNRQVARLWEAIEFGIHNYQEDHNVLATLLRIALEEMQAGLARKD